MNKFFTLLVSVLCVMAILCSCGTTVTEQTTEPTEEITTERVNTAVNVSVLKGPTGMQMAYLMHTVNSGEYDGKNVYSFNVETAADAVTSDLVSGKTDIAAIPSNAAAALYAKTEGKVKIIATNTLNVLCLLAKDGVVSDFASLEGKTITASGEGTTAQYILEKILSANGLVPGENVTVEYTAEHSESVTRAKEGLCDIVVLPEPFATQLLLADCGFVKAIDFSACIESMGLDIVMGVYVVRTEFLEQNPEAVAEFLSDGLASHTFLTSSCDVAATYIEEADIMTAAVAAKAIPNIAFRFKTGDEMKEMCNGMFELLYEVNPQSIGGALPDEGIYY